MKRFILCSLLLVSLSLAQNQPKHEFRAVWVATVYRLDFPIANWSTASMQAEITQMVDSLHNNGFNAIVFQVRPECDAFYASAYEPWSRHLTGTSGQPPSPYFDPLEAWINEAHAHNMELHAWFNPYRVTTMSNPAALHPTHVYHQHPEWILSVGTRENGALEGMYSNTLESERDLRSSLILDPGMEVVQEYVVNVFMDVVNNYDVDGVHMDDYFYPYGGMNGEDAQTFSNEPRGFGDIENWRRDNVNRLVAGIYDSIQVVKPWVKYGVSPFGIWKSGYPAGIVGTSSYYELYCDPIAWLNAGTIDYLTPQLYWAHGGGQDYALLMPWWADSVSTHDRHLYVGHAPYRMTDFHNWPASELPRQIRLNRGTEGCQGSVMFRLRNGVVNNPKGFLDSLDNDYYQYTALRPPMLWKDAIPPNPPTAVALLSEPTVNLSWLAPDLAEDGDTAYQYVIYASDQLPIDVDQPVNILRVVSAEFTSVELDGNASHYAVSALDRLGNESVAVAASSTHVTERSQPDRPVLLGNFPNPFNPSTQIRYQLDEPASVSLTIHDVFGHQVKYISQGFKLSGSYNVQWDAHDDEGTALAAGIYFGVLKVNNDLYSHKMIYLR